MGAIYFSVVRTEDIKIYEDFKKHPPSWEKMQKREKEFREMGDLTHAIVLNEKGYLIDGYSSYLLAKQQGIQRVLVYRGQRQIIKGYHRKGGKLYDWELPGWLIDEVASGDRVAVHTRDGIKTVTVAAVEDYNPDQYTGPLRKAIKKRRSRRQQERRA